MNRLQEKYLSNMIKQQARDTETMKKKINEIEQRLEIIAPEEDEADKLTAYEVMLEIKHLNNKALDGKLTSSSYIAIQTKIERLCDVLKKTYIEY